MVWLLMFSAFSTAFGFVVNDLSDAELDRSAGVIRNPVSTGELSSGRCISVALILLFVSLVACARASPLTYFIIAPITQTTFNEDHVDKMLREIREKRLIMIALLIAALILGRIYDPLA